MKNPAPMVSTLVLMSLITVGCGGAQNGNNVLQNESRNAQSGSTVATQNQTTNETNSSGPANIAGPSSSKSAHPNKHETSGNPLKPQHIVVVVEENHGYNRIVGNKNAPYINSLIQNGALFTNYHAVAHPSQPNYLALFAGSTLGIRSDSCPNTFSSSNLGSELIAKHLSFTGYSESLPTVGFKGCSTRTYARKHAPWVDFSNLPNRLNQPFSHFPKKFSQLPTVSFVIPNVQNDMHSGSVAAGDRWLKNNIGAYAKWAKSHDSLLFVTFDEGYSQNNRVAAVFSGARVKAGRYNQPFTHYSMLRTIESFYNLSPLGQSKNAKPMSAALNYR